MVLTFDRPWKNKKSSPLISKIEEIFPPGLIQMLLLLDLLLLFLLYVFNHVLIRGRKVPPNSYVVNTYSRTTPL